MESSSVSQSRTMKGGFKLTNNKFLAGRRALFFVVKENRGRERFLITISIFVNVWLLTIFNLICYNIGI